MKKVLAIALLSILAVLVIPQLALAMEHPQANSQAGTSSHGAETNDDHGDDGGHGETGDHDNGQEVIASFHIRLVGDQQVPAVNTTAFGLATVTLVNNVTLEFKLVVCNIANVTASHIHVGAAGTNGPVAVPFFSEPQYPFSTPHGCALLAAGIRTPSDLTNNEGVPNWNGFVHDLLTNDTYINVHTTQHPMGEIRGQLILHSEHAQDHDDGQQVESSDAETNDD